LEANQQEILEDDINQEIWQVYEQNSEALPKVARHLTKQPLQKLHKFPGYYKKQWMATLGAVHTFFQCQQEGLSRGEQQLMHNYMTWLTNGL